MSARTKMCPTCTVCPLDQDPTDRRTRIEECANCGYRARVKGGRRHVLAEGDVPSLALGSGRDALEESDRLRLDDLCYERG